MKKVLLIATAILICAQTAYGQAGYVGVYADEAGTICHVGKQQVGGLMWTYLAHILSGPATGVGFQLVTGGGFGGTIFAEEITPPYSATGTLMGGMQIDYGSCTAQQPIMFYTIIWTMTGTDPDCAWILVRDDPTTTFSGVEVRDCALPSANSFRAPGMIFTVGGEYYVCACEDFNPVFESTWGAIKSLYR